MFLETAMMVAHPILLGVYFQIFGGLRSSEVINICRNNVRIMASGTMNITLLNNNLRIDLKSIAGVKKPRTQNIMNIFNWLPEFYSNHISLYIPEDGSNSLFVNRDKSALTIGSYRQYFNKLKKTFIERLTVEDRILEDKILGKHLADVKWSTHIGRGTFTNLIAEETENVAEIAHLRGDSNYTSALSYMSDTERMAKKVEEKFSLMHSRFKRNF